jgi:hypothetical protein
MPDLPSRSKHEADILALLIPAFEAERKRYLDSGKFDQRSMARGVRVAVEDRLVDVFTAAVRQLAGQQGWELDTARLSVEARVWATRRAVDLGNEVAANTNAFLRDTSDLSSIDSLFGEGRAEGMAITEVTSAISAGETWLAIWASTAILGSDREIIVSWHTEHDARVCELCGPLDGRPREQWQMAFPGGPPAHPRCRCWLEYDTVPKAA